MDSWMHSIPVFKRFNRSRFALDMTDACRVRRNFCTGKASFPALEVIVDHPFPKKLFLGRQEKVFPVRVRSKTQTFSYLSPQPAITKCRTVTCRDMQMKGESWQVCHNSWWEDTAFGRFRIDSPKSNCWPGCPRQRLCAFYHRRSEHRKWGSLRSGIARKMLHNCRHHLPKSLNIYSTTFWQYICVYIYIYYYYHYCYYYHYHYQ